MKSVWVSIKADKWIWLASIVYDVQFSHFLPYESIKVQIALF